MPRYEDDYDDLSSQRRRDNLMQRRLRKARGEEIDDDDDSGVDNRYPDYDDDYDDYDAPPRRYRSAPAVAQGGGCAQATLYVMLGSIAVALIAVFFFMRMGSSIGSAFGGVVPNIEKLVATPTATIRTDAAAVVRQVQQLNRLETTSFTIEKVIEAGNEGSIFYNMLYKDKLLLIAHGTVVAGVDLSKIKESDVSVSSDGETVTLRLPPVEIFSAALDNSKTRVYQRDQAPLAGDKDLETQARQAAEGEILKAACEDGILTRASADAKQSVEQLFKLADFKEVIVIAPSGGQCAAPTGPGAVVVTPTP